MLPSLAFAASAVNAGPEPWQAAYFELLKEYNSPGSFSKNRMQVPRYVFVDFNQDGVPELIINPGPHGFDVEFLMNIYTYADGRVRQFNEGIKDVNNLEGFFEGLPDGYRNKKTGEMKWICPGSEESENLHGLLEMDFDFDTYLIKFTPLPFQYYRYGSGDNDFRWTLSGKEITQKQYKKAKKDWEKTYKLVIPREAYYDYRNLPETFFPNIEAFWPYILEVSNKALTLNAIKTDRHPLLRSAAVLGGIGAAAAAIAVPAALAKKRKKKQ